MTPRQKAILTLLRPANIITSLADVAAGLAVAGFYSATDANPWLALPLFIATVGFYGGGIVLNDAFDAAVDQTERPERPIPSGLVTVKEAKLLGFSLLASGVLATAFVNPVALMVGVILAGSILLYNTWAKHNITGPVVMGACRGLNLMLGMSLLPGVIEKLPLLPLVHVVYIAGITLVSRDEVKGKRRAALWLALVVFILTPTFVFLTTLPVGATATLGYPVLSGAFIGLLASRTLKAIREPSPQHIKLVVKSGVIGIIALDAIIVSRVESLAVVAQVLLLLPLSLFVARKMAVT